MEVHFKLVGHGSEEWKRAVQLREEILRIPLGSYFTAEELEEERNHIQIIGLMDNDLVATTVLVPEGNSMKMQRVVVKSPLQGSGIGSKMMSFSEKYAMEQGKNYIYCHARDSAVDFYLKNKYLIEGDYFPEDGIPHLLMFKVIA